MLQILKQILTPILSLIILTLGNGLFTTYTSLRMEIEGQSPIIIGYISAAFFAGIVIGSIRAHKLIERIGHIRTFAALASSVAAFTMLQGVFFNPWTWGVIRFLTGICTAGLFITIESWLLAKSSVNTKGKILSLYMISFYAAQSIGQFLINLSSLQSIIPFACGVVLAAFSVVPITLTKVPSPSIEEPSYLNIRKMIKISPLGILGTLVSGLILGTIYGINPIFGKYLNMDTYQLSLFMGITIFGGLVLQWPIGQISDHIDRRKVLMVISIMIAFLSLLVALLDNYSFLTLLIIIGLFGGFAFTIFPLSVSHASDKLEPKDYVAAIGCLTLIYGIGAVIGPIISSYCMSYLGNNGVFYFYIIVSLLLGLCSFIRILKVNPIPEKEKVQFISLPRPSSLTGELDPRTEEKK